MPRKRTDALCHCGSPVKARGLCAPHYMQDYQARNAERIAARQAEWRKSNATKLLADKLAYREEHREELARKQREYAAANPEMARINGGKSTRARRARLLGVASERYSADDVLALYGTDCHLCGQAIDMDVPRRIGWEGWELGLQIDHLIPLSKGGDNTLKNARPSHGICNLRKGSVS